MTASWRLARLLSQPVTLWALFGIILMVAAGGLTVLSSEALRLSDEQQVAQQRARQEQNLRVALWRLDSRLGPYVATLHDPDVGNLFASSSDQFVLRRFRIALDASGRKGTLVFDTKTDLSLDDQQSQAVPNQRDTQQAIEESLTIDGVLAAFDSILPRSPPNSDQSLVQSYAVQIPRPDAPSNQHELSNRNAIVQRQVQLNTFKSAKGGSVALDPNAAADQARLMSAWIGDQLLVVRSSRDAQNEMEGVWLDWNALRRSLLRDVSDLLPDADLVPVRPSERIQPDRTLAAIPAMVRPAAITSIVQPWSATHTSLLIAWIAFALAAVVAAVALDRLIALSQRRASFVSAVTHEMRTPLTTFRLYSDLLARNMVAREQDRQEYLETLRREADRLTHLVDNVLRYSKLQQTSTTAVLENVQLSEWIARISPRLRSRLACTAMELVIEQVHDGSWATDPPAMEQLLFNLVDNAAKYAASATDRRVHLRAEFTGECVVLTVSDHGPGVPKTLRNTIFRPFAKSAEQAAETAAGVGLGLALARRTAQALGGSLVCSETSGGGASFRVTVPRSAGGR